MLFEKSGAAHKRELRFKYELNTIKTQWVIHEPNFELFSMQNPYPGRNWRLRTGITHSIFELSSQKKFLRIRLDEL